ncbi:MAG: hypothetical protein ABIP57_21540 [Jatrophihabitantaceae bacterium]
MTGPTDDQLTNVQHIEITDNGHTLAAAEVRTPTDSHGTAHIVLHAESGHLPIGTRAHLVDAVLDLPNVQSSDHLQAYAPTGDSESLDRLRQRTTDLRSHVAGCTAIIEAELNELCDCLPADPADPA